MPEVDPFQLPFVEAIDWFANKTNLDTDTWRDTLDIATDAVFTVAAAKGELLQDIRDAVSKAQSEGQSMADFLKQFDRIADRYSPNWALKGSKAWRGQLIYEQNTRAAHNAGREQQMSDPTVMKLRPYHQWVHGDSRIPRPVHLAMDGMVFNAGEVPLKAGCGFHCRCQILSLTRRDLVRRGLSVSTLKLGDEIDGVTIAPDPGFERTKKERMSDNLDKLDPAIRKQVESELGAEFKLAEGTTRRRNGVNYILTNSRWHRVDGKIEDESLVSEALQAFGLGNKAVDLGNTYVTASSISLRNARSPVISGTPGLRQQILADARNLVSLDINRGVTLNKVSRKNPDKQIDLINAIASTMLDGDTIQFKGTLDHPVATKLGLHRHGDISTNGSIVVHTGIVRAGKISGVDEAHVNAISEIRTARQNALRGAISVDSYQQWMSTLSTQRQAEVRPQLEAAIALEKSGLEILEKKEDKFLGRRQSQVYTYGKYAQKAEEWSRAKFGDFSEGANGFSLAQTKAHDIAHPITHELIGMDSDKIHAHFGKMTDTNGTKTLHAEEAIVNAMEQLSRGATIEQAILNGTRLARVTTRSDANRNQAHVDYVRSPEFTQKLSDLVHKAYRNDNFTPLMEYVRISNRISGTVRSAGDDFTSTATGG